ncbi:ChrR family anti-sigma-E factor [Hirschia baltica]|uniref:Anti-ECFsigma factor, ChrR n=1 Tax=Hirschia baltica (strain ATCC 49814 / DSM 5838 / IFAM 1418) TaxID=582402 RepID=C6XIS2_HIRBI|nr:ChrR family anti-sigma-E factor [Hirschia baltica]ACT59017.1 anti-ECFsigma factor, ChrR [Hirschia baltica ATCC 49814]
MKISHHVNDDFLYLYAAGDLDYSWSLAVATHLAMCSHCRQRVALFEDVLAVSMEENSTETVSLSAMDLLDNMDEAEISDSDVKPTHSATLENETPVFPEPLRSLAGDLKDIKWSTMGGGVKQKILHEQDGLIARLLYIPAGVAAASHGHNGVELTQVVAGGYYDGDQAFNLGDMQTVGHDAPHQPIAMQDSACVCLAVTDAPLKFQNMLPRLFQKFFRI